jgi:thioredoxin reductase (NADPH)
LADWIPLQTGEKKRLEVAGMFYGIGHQPNSGLIKEFVELDEKGYVKVRGGKVRRGEEGKRSE